MIGKTLGHYEILEQLGQGGMGVVYKARDIKLDRLVAIKILPPDKTADASRKQRFIREARAASALNHPNIVIIHEIAEDQGVDYIVMEFVSGRTLDHAIPRKGMRTGEVLGYAAQMAAALAAAHEAGITHRDLKPGNVMISDKGVVKVLDFGLAKLSESGVGLGQNETTRTERPDTEEGAIVGTIAYMSPEQAEGKPVDTRSDIFSFGAVLYEMLTGRKAFPGGSKLSTLSAILKEDPPPLRAVAGEVPGELERIVARCLRKDPARRFQSTVDLRLAIEELSEESDSGRLSSNSGTGTALVSRVRRPRWPLAVAVSAVWLTGAGVWWLNSKRSATSGTASGDQAQQGPVLTQLTFDTGFTTEPAYWANGNLIAYASDRATNGQHLDIWIQQLNGGEARRLTTHGADDHEPTFSPDGSTIAFRSERDGGGIFLVPTIGGAERKLVDGGHAPKFSPDGKWVTYFTGDPASYSRFIYPTVGTSSVWVVAASGGPPRVLEHTARGSRPVWSPDGKTLLFASARNDVQDWLTINPEDNNEPKKTGLLPLLNRKKFVPRITYLSWTPAGLVFTGQLGDSVNTWKVALDPVRLEVAGEPERITSGSGIETHPSLAGNTLIYANSLNNDDIWYLGVDHAVGRATGAPVRVTNTTASDVSSTVSHDGTKIGYGSFISGGVAVLVHNLATGLDTRLTTIVASGVPGLNISPDGNSFAWMLGEKLETYLTGTDGTSKLVCQECQLRSWDGTAASKILFTRRGESYLLDPETRSEIKVMDTVGSGIHLSWDAKWAIFYVVDGSISNVYLCPIAPGRVATKADFIAVNDGKSMDILPELSPDVNTAYYLSHRDGFQCLWAQRLDPASKKPTGAPFALQHFHSARVSPAYVPGGRRRMDTARDKIVFTMAERTGNIWKAELPAGGR